VTRAQDQAVFLHALAAHLDSAAATPHPQRAAVTAPLSTISYVGGVQSTAMIVLAVNGKLGMPGWQAAEAMAAAS
jgi:hypothetical protein